MTKKPAPSKPPAPVRHIAIIGAGISGLAVAHGLSEHGQVALFEAGGYFGGQFTGA